MDVHLILRIFPSLIILRIVLRLIICAYIIPLLDKAFLDVTSLWSIAPLAVSVLAAVTAF